MTAGNDNEQNLDNRRKKLKFRAWHRGIKEMDIILGNFADRYLESFDTADLDEFERLLQIPDQAFYAMLAHNAPIPDIVDTPLFHRILQFSKDPLGARAPVED